jgi:hypothetical protein
MQTILISINLPYEANVDNENKKNEDEPINPIFLFALLGITILAGIVIVVKVVF